MKTLYGIQWQPKDPVVLDEALLKTMACSHLPEDNRTFINRDGIEEKWCSACRTFESDLPLKI